MPFTLQAKSGHSSHPQLWLGTWSLGGEGFGPVDGRESVLLLQKALAAGFRHFDSAQFYAHGKSEAYLAKAIKRSGIKREEIFISSKGGLNWQGNIVIHDGSEKALRNTLHKSLNTYQTDYLDLYQLHWPDPNTPIEESLESLKQFQQEGLIQHWGVGNLSAQQVSLYCQDNSRIPHQVHHNPLHHSDTVLVAGKKNNRCYNCCISPFEQGLLVRDNFDDAIKKLGKKDVRQRNPYFTEQKYRDWLKDYYQFAAALEFTRQEFLLLWQLNNPQVDTLIVGPKTLKQLAEITPVLENLDDYKNLEFENIVQEKAQQLGLENQFLSSIFKA